MAKPFVELKKLYLKDVSLETPNSPNIFQAEWKPDVSLNLNIETKQLNENLFEVVLMVTATNKIDENVAFLAEVKQAGIFQIVNIDVKDEELLRKLLLVDCPTILLPYARETVSSLTGNAGFIPLYLGNIDFETLYQNNRSKTNG